MSQQVRVNSTLKVNFELFNGVDEPRTGGTMEQSKVIFALLPDCVSVCVSPPFIQLGFSVLPPRPWPLKIAGLVAWFRTDGSSEPDVAHFLSRRGKAARGPSLKLQADLARWKVPATDVLRQAMDELEQKGFGVIELQKAVILSSDYRFRINRRVAIETSEIYQ